MDLLTEVATFAVAIPGADGAGLTLIEAGRADTIVKSEPFVRTIDDIQYAIGEGPCISAARRADRCGQGRWRRPPVAPFGPTGRTVGRAQCALAAADQRATDRRCHERYAHAKDAFDERAEHLGQALRAPRRDRGAECADPRADPRLAASSRLAMTGRAVIDQAIGILMSRSGSLPTRRTQDRLLSQHDNTKMVVVAAGIVHEAVRRARARHTEET